MDEIREKYAPPDHNVFNVVPPVFKSVATVFCNIQNYSVITHENIWRIYSNLMAHYRTEPISSGIGVLTDAKNLDSTILDSDFIPILNLLPYRLHQHMTIGSAGQQHTEVYSSDEVQTEFEAEWTESE